MIKNIDLPDNIQSFYESIEAGVLQPNTKCKMDIKTEGSILTIHTECEFDDIKNVYIVAYDKKEIGVLACQEMSFNYGNEFNVDISGEFAEVLKNTSDIKYARMCMAVETAEKSYFFYLMSSDKEEFDEYDCYIGTLGKCDNQKKSKHLIVYYSQAGLLSIKYVPVDECYKKYYKCLVDKLCHMEDKLLINMECVSIQGIESNPVLVSCTTNKVVETMQVNIIEKSPISDFKEKLSCEVQLEPKYDKYYLAYQIDGQIFDIEIPGVEVTDVEISNAEIQNVEISDIEVLDAENSTGEQVYENGFTEQIYSLNSEVNYNVVYRIDDKRRLNISIAEHIYPYMFSIVMAVYNTEQFLEEALNSVLKQNTRALEKFIIGKKTDKYNKQNYLNVYQVIMVDDGATDNSGAICDRFASENEHFTVIHKENGGVSTARNAGIEIAEGKYINFMDSDDKLSDNVLSACFDFFEKNYDKTDMITFPIKFFDAAKGEHWLNGKFNNGNRIINIMEEYDKAIMFVNASVFKTEKIKGKINFESTLTTGEDIRFIYSLFFNEGARFGVLGACTYWYRRRSAGEASAIQASKSSRNFYYEYLSGCLDWLLSEGKATYGFVPQFVQYLVAQQLQWRFKEDEDAAIAKSVLNDEEFEEYKNHIKCQLEQIDVSIILEQKKIFREQKKYILEMKKGEKLIKYFDGKDVNYFYESTKVSTASSNYLRLEFIKFIGNKLYVEGYNMSYENDSELYLKVDDDYILLERNERDMSVYALGEPIFFASSFKQYINLDDCVDRCTIGFYEKIDGNYVKKNDLRYAKTMPLSKTYTKSYYVENHWAIRLEGSSYVITNLLEINNASKIFRKYEDEYLDQVSKKINKENEKEALAFRKELVPFITSYKMYNKKRIWLISDRVNMAGDNGEAFYLYMLQKDLPDIDMYFVINDNCPDYERLKTYGNVVVQNSKKHKLLHFLAEYIISSQANEYVINPFYHEGTTEIFRDLLYKPKFVFLQHGVIKDDLSDWLNRYKKDMTGFVTAAIPEHKSILDYDYYYSENEVWLTGLPRHDRLYNDEKKYITIMPTWRKYLSAASPNDPEVTVVKEGFDESKFFQFYNNLINNERLIEAASNTGYTVCFMPHPNIMNNLDMFEHNPQVKFFGTEKPYREIFAESNLVMTDYSSSIMDFAYLRKPIVYCHFDQEEFFSGDHVYVKGYFEYERDGFGEVTYDLEDLVDVLIEYMNDGCELKSVYRERMDKFFAYNDNKNCERLYNRLMDEAQ